MFSWLDIYQLLLWYVWLPRSSAVDMGFVQDTFVAVIIYNSSCTPVNLLLRRFALRDSLMDFLLKFLCRPYETGVHGLLYDFPETATPSGWFVFACVCVCVYIYVYKKDVLM